MAYWLILWVKTMSNIKLTVTQISNYIKNIFDNEELLIGVSVVGEITNLKPSSRAIYFDVKDDNASLPCVCFDQFLLNGFAFGDKVSVTGKLNYYAKTGKLSFIVSKIEKFGIGELYKEFLELKKTLEKEGLFDETKKKPLPKFVKKVGVVTSETGAVIKDIIRVKSEKNSLSSLVLYPVKVQGVGADTEIVRAIEYLDKMEDVDCIIVARGGGSFEDYQPFNTEKVARAVFNAKTPIVSAIGHETDWSIIDYVSDARAGTPSIASEMVFFDENQVIAEMKGTLSMQFSNYLSNLNANLKELKINSQGLSDRFLGKLKFSQNALEVNKIKLINSITNALSDKKQKLEILSSRLSNSNPVEILNRGYSVTNFEGSVIKSVKNIKPNSKIKTILSDGEIVSVVESVKVR